MISDFIRVPYANHMLARLPDGLDPLRVAAASDSLVDGWRFPKPHEAYDIVVDASNVPTGITHAVRSTAPGGICVVPSYHMALVTGVPLMHMTFTSITLHVSTTNAAAVLPEVLTWVHDNDFPAEKVTPEVSDWSEAPTVYATKSMEKPVLYRSPLT
ncbi:alcohol dehydrogenase [Mycobacteroides abscessus subsp. abscessus]|nr:alcohol dehydrogenase [Mycobacteroides abscessus subsp. abscessus]